MDDIKSQFTAGTAIWLSDKEHCWLKAIVIEIRQSSSSSKKFTLKCQMDDINCSSSETRELEFSLDNLPHLRNTTLNEDRLDDLTNLSHLNDPAVLNTIHCRYLDNSIYTYSGLVLVSLNPYCDLGLYGDSLIQAYSGKSRGELEPHLFTVAEDAFRSMQRDQKNQSIIISGESGAGKTISARYVMRYFASAANAHLSNDISETSSLIESRVLASNPILEAFGNAKTTRNDNSSRFGKYMQIFFDSKDEITGAAIKTYLLEKTRVTKQSPGERNYHIFYQLLEGSDETSKKELGLDGLTWKDFEYLKSAGRSIENVNDSEEFALTKKSLKIAGFSEEVQLKIFKILSAILHLGNLKFEENEEDSTATISSADQNLKTFAGLLDASEKTEELSRWFTRKLLITKLEEVEIRLTLKQAEAAKDAISKFLYSKVFDFIVKKLNELLSPPASAVRTKNRFIGVLDIYGFEKFDTNSFEQFCINYANEKLQHEFNQQVFKLEQELYEREEINWSFINFSDNQPCINLIEIRGGILDLLDEECRFPNGGDVSFLDKIKAEIPKKGTDVSGYLGSDPLEQPGTFTIKHFAYDVAYSVEGFLEKNRDLIPNEIIQILENDASDGIIEVPSQIVSKTTTGSAFRESLSELMKIIQSTQVHYIRCIKPNNNKEAMQFEPNFVMQQLRAGGIIETIKISAAGYPARWPFEEFFTRYSLLGRLQSNSGDYKELALKLLESQEDLQEDEYQIGKTQIFLRAGILARLEKKRTRTLRNAATLIQSTLRSIWIERDICSYFKKIKLIQSSLRKHLSVELFKELRLNQSMMIIQKTFKMHAIRVETSKKISAIKMIQNQWRSHYKQTYYAEELRHRMALRIQTVYKGRRNILLSNLKSYSAKQIQNAFKYYKSHEELKLLRKEAKSFEKLRETSLGLEKKVIDLTRELDVLRVEENESKQVKNEELAKVKELLKQREERIRELEEEISVQNTKIEGLEEKVKEIQKESSVNLAEQESLHAERIKSMKLRHETELKEQNNDSKSLEQKYKELKEEKGKLEMKFAKVEQYVRTLMANHIKSHVKTNLSDGSDESDEQFDKMASQNSLMNFISVEDEAKLIKFTSTTEVLEELLKSDSIIEELTGMIRVLEGMESFDEEIQEVDQELLLRPSRIIYSWLILSLSVPSLYDLTELRMNSVLESIRVTLSESTDDKKCSLWLTNLVNLYGMIHYFIIEKEEQLKQNHVKLRDKKDREDGKVVLSPVSNASSPTTQISVSELPPPVLLLIRAEVMRLIGDIYSAWLKELCRWFGRAGIAAILEYEALPNYKVRERKKSEKFLESVLNTLVSSDKPASSDQQSLSINGLLDALDDLLEAFIRSTLDLEISQGILLIIFRHVAIICFNQLLLKRNFISWKRAIQIQFNLSRLEDWCRERLASFGIDQDAVDSFAPLLQAVKIIQLAKTRGVDSGVLQQCAPNLSTIQIRKLLTNYVPDDFEDGPVPIDLIRQFPPPNEQQPGSALLPQLDLNKLALPTVLKERNPPSATGMAAELPLDMPPTLWKLFVLYLK